MENQNKGRKGDRPNPAKTLGFTAFFLTLPIYSPNLVALYRHDPYDLMAQYAGGVIAAGIITALLVALASARGSKINFSNRLFVTVGSVMYFIGTLVYCLLLALDMPKLVIGTFAGICSGVGLVFPCLAWGRIYSVFGLQNSLLNVLFACTAAAVLNWLFEFLPIAPMLSIFLIALITGVALPVFRSWSGLLDDPENPINAYTENDFPFDNGQVCDGKNISNDIQEKKTESKSTIDNEAAEGVLPLLTRFRSILLVPFIGLAVFAFSQGAHKVVVLGAFNVETIGSVLAALLVLPLCFFRPGKPLISFINHIYLPAIAGFVIALNSIPSTSEVIYQLDIITMYTFFAVVGLISLASACAVAHAREFPSELIFSVIIMLFLLSAWLGMRVCELPYVVDYKDAFLKVLTTVYCIFLLIQPGRSLWRTMLEPSQNSAVSASTEHTLRRRCLELADGYSLSPRETEIIGYLGRGYSSVYIAKTLLLSENTVYTHVHNIYRKLGISSRDELLRIIDAHS